MQQGSETRRATPFRRFRSPVAATMLSLGLAAASLGFSAPVSAQSTINCAEAVTSAPTGPATVSAASTSYGQVLIVGSGDYAGCSLYLLTSDALHALTGAPFACSDDPNPTGEACDTVLWPALLTEGAPIAGPGINPALLGMVTRSDLPGLGTVHQVTYAGQPLYRFFLDEGPGETDGANLFDPVTSPTGIWYLVNPSRGRAAPGRAHLGLETAPVNVTGPEQTVLSVSMNHGFALLNNGTFPVYTLSTDSHRGRDKSACQAACAAVYWPPVLTSGQPMAEAGVDQSPLGIVVRPDGGHQVTYQGHPLYLFFNDAYIPGFPYNDGAATINGAGANSPWGVFNTIPPLP